MYRMIHVQKDGNEVGVSLATYSEEKAVDTLLERMSWLGEVEGIAVVFGDGSRLEFRKGTG
jgi:hypothetical protein